jgi:hypothetical protein
MKKSFTLVEDFFYVLSFSTTIKLFLRRTLVLLDFYSASSKNA